MRGLAVWGGGSGVWEGCGARAGGWGRVALPPFLSSRLAAVVVGVGARVGGEGGVLT